MALGSSCKIALYSGRRLEWQRVLWQSATMTVLAIPDSFSTIRVTLLEWQLVIVTLLPIPEGVTVTAVHRIKISGRQEQIVFPPRKKKGKRNVMLLEPYLSSCNPQCNCAYSASRLHGHLFFPMKVGHISGKALYLSIISIHGLSWDHQRIGTNCIKIGLPRKSFLGDYFQETFSLTENQFSGTTYFYTIASRPFKFKQYGRPYFSSLYFRSNWRKNRRRPLSRHYPRLTRQCSTTSCARRTWPTWRSSQTQG